MLLQRENDTLKINGEHYSLSFPKDQPFVFADDAGGQNLMELFVPSSIHTLTWRDDSIEMKEAANGAWCA